MEFTYLMEGIVFGIFSVNVQNKDFFKIEAEHFFIIHTSIIHLDEDVLV